MKKLYISISLVFTFLIAVYATSVFISGNRLLDEAYYLSKINILMFDSWKTLGGEDRKELNNLVAIHLNRYRIASQNVPKFLKTEKMKKEICFSFLTPSQKDWNYYKSMLTKKGLYEYVKDTITDCHYRYKI